MRSISTANSRATHRWISGLVLGLFLAPTLYVLHLALFSESADSIGRLADTVLPDYLGNTLSLLLQTLALALAIGLGSAFAIVYFDFPGRRLLSSALVLPLVLPPYLVAIVYREMSHRSEWFPSVESLGGASVVLALTLYPYIFLLARTAFARQARRYIEIGQTLGLVRWRIAVKALLPLAAPAIVLASLLVIVEAISDYGTPSFLGARTLTIVVHRIWFDQFDPGLAAQVSLFGLIPALVLVGIYALSSRHRSYANPCNRPRPARPVSLPQAQGWLLAMLCLLPVVLGFVLPVVILAYWALPALSRYPLDRLYGDLGQTVLLATLTAVLAVLAGGWLAVTHRWHPARWLSVSSLAIVSLNYALPAIVLALALLSFSGLIYHTVPGEWLSNSIALVLLATVLRYTGFALFSIESGLAGVSSSIDDAIAAMGKGHWQGLYSIFLPLLRAPITVAALLVFVIAAKDLTLSIVLQPFGYSSLPLSIYYFANIDVFDRSALHALCLVLILLYPVLSLNRWLGKR